MPSMASILSRKLELKPRSWNRVALGSFSAPPEYHESRPIEKILIANRGEIACRIMRTAKRLGIRTVAVYSDADRDSLHLKSADEAVSIGPPPARLSYLNASSVIEAAIRTGAQAIHPGYGFLSESADFAQLCEDKGLTFIGPPASAIQEMGDKSASKRIMGAAGVPLVPGYHGDEQDLELMRSEADKIGYPILIKPTHGGGGKGMRIVQSPNEFVESFLAARREAAASFGRDTILLEKYITQPRHIEVQIFGDKHGNTVHLNERDCSVQRRHQKIIEEAPAPDITNDFRSHLGQAAVSAAKAVGYYNAGTVEFIVDTVSDEFYFMEMNTRLQVEHPVTEMIVGQDLVEWQIRVANGERLQLDQSQVPLSGHAFEARIYAENVPKGFLPATGILHHYRPVPVSSTVRVETGVEQGDTVSMHYDPMIAKLVIWGENRSAALVKLKDCLSKFQVAGLPTNINFLLKIANHCAFESGKVETHFIEHYKDDLFVNLSNSILATEEKSAAKFGAALVAACIHSNEHSTLRESTPGDRSSLSIWYAHPPFRVHHHARHTMELECENACDSTDSEQLTLSITYQPHGNYLIEAGESRVEVKVARLGKHDFRVEANGVSKVVSLTTYCKDQIKHIHIWHGSHHHHFRQKMGIELSDDHETQSKPSFEAASHSPGTVVAPMAGLVVKVLVKDGTRVDKGQSIVVLEAMKMEHVVKAPSSGHVHRLQVKAGQQVSDGSVLFCVKVHLDYLEAGADIIITASYQATLQGFEAKGFSKAESESLLRKSVEIACEARDIYYQGCKEGLCNSTRAGRVLNNRTILVAASVGSYGAYLADGSEYSGDYGAAITLEALKNFHRRRVQILAEAGADIVAFETVPNKLEAQAYVQLLEEEDIKIPAWMSFNSKDGVNVVSGDSLLECAAIADACRKVVAVGINCTPPRYIHELILCIKKVTNKPILIYPNSGESYDANRKEWMQNTGVSDEDFVSYVNTWWQVGASLIGGCCRTTPDTIRSIYRTLSGRHAAPSLQG